jgi:hypothetical protein
MLFHARRFFSSVANIIPAQHSPMMTLAGSQWDIRLIPQFAASAAAAQADRLRFTTTSVASEALSAHGFSGSAYTVIRQPEGGILWETMQAGPGGETVCWRGECDGRRMRGVMTRQKDGKETESFNFIAVNPMSEA